MVAWIALFVALLAGLPVWGAVYYAIKDARKPK